MTDERKRPTRYHRMSHAVSATVGHATVVASAILGTAVWIGIGVWTSFPKEWLLVTNLTGTLAVFLLLLLLQHSRQIHVRSIHTKLNELIRTGDGGNHLIGAERLADEMLEDLRARHRAMARKDRT